MEMLIGGLFVFFVVIPLLIWTFGRGIRGFLQALGIGLAILAWIAFGLLLLKWGEGFLVWLGLNFLGLLIWIIWEISKALQGDD